MASKQKNHKKTKCNVRKWKLTGARKTVKHPGLLSPKDITNKLTWVFRLGPRVNPLNLRHRKKNIRYELLLAWSQS